MSKITNVRLPNASQSGYDPQQFNQLVRSLEQIVFQLNNTYTPVVTEDKDAALTWYEASGFNQSLSSAGAGMLLPYGSFFDTTTQSVAAINTPKAMTYNNAPLANQMYVGSPTSRIYVDLPGIYNFQFSVQLDKSSGSSAQTYIWPRLNGANIANSASIVTVQGTNAELVAAWNFVLDLNGGDYFELMWQTDDLNLQLTAAAATATVPAIPSVILTVTFMSSLR
jgi:hypothetical protein